MANKNKSKKSSNSSGTPSLNKVAFFTLVVAAIVYLVNIILSAVGVASAAVAWIGAVVTVMLFIFAAILGWRYIKNQNMYAKILYFVVLCIIIIGVILPIVL